MAEIDIKDFFDTIPLDSVLQMLRQKIHDETVTTLLRKYLYCKIDTDGRIIDKNVGLVQGNSISPILSNMYLHPLDLLMESRNYRWIRFADNIYLFCESQKAAIDLYEAISTYISANFGLEVNRNKSGVHNVLNKPILGYDLYRTKGKIDIRKHQYRPADTYQKWHPSVVQKINQEYHILQDGVLNKKDYALLFENEQEKHHIPVEVVDQLNVYGEVSMSYSVLRTLGNRNIKVSFFDKYGNLMGNYIPERHHSNAVTMLKQCIVEINEQKDIGKLMLLEARARQKYYKAFNLILEHTEFTFSQRTKRPPKDQLNALLSFGNTLLYNQFLQILWKTSLNPQIGVVHAANRRNYSLNLDFADIFKPVIVDRVIFTLLNCQRLKKEEHFEEGGDGGVFLNKRGKKIFLEEFEQKLETMMVNKGKSITYRQLMREEVWQFQKHILTGEKYKPYKYY